MFRYRYTDQRGNFTNAVIIKIYERDRRETIHYPSTIFGRNIVMNFDEVYMKNFVLVSSSLIESKFLNRC